MHDDGEFAVNHQVHRDDLLLHVACIHNHAYIMILLQSSKTITGIHDEWECMMIGMF